MCLRRLFIRTFAGSAVTLLLVAAGIGLSRPSEALASTICPGGSQLCGTETTCVGAFWWKVCETLYYYQEPGGGGTTDPEPLEPCYICGTIDP